MATTIRPQSTVDIYLNIDRMDKEYNLKLNPLEIAQAIQKHSELFRQEDTGSYKIEVIDTPPSKLPDSFSVIPPDDTISYCSVEDKYGKCGRVVFDTIDCLPFYEDSQEASWCEWDDKYDEYYCLYRNIVLALAKEGILNSKDDVKHFVEYSIAGLPFTTSKDGYREYGVDPIMPQEDYWWDCFWDEQLTKELEETLAENAKNLEDEGL